MDRSCDVFDFGVWDVQLWPLMLLVGVLAQEGITAPELSAHGNDYGRLRFQRLSTYLKIRRPEATIGYSIFVYRLTAAELAAATEGSAGDLLALVERAASTSTP